MRAETPTPVEYLYAEANEGGSSGGHVALRLGDEVFHYQQRDRLLRLLRTDLADFLAEYALAGNRTVHALRLGVLEETAARLRAGFATRRRAFERQLDRLALLRADRELLEQAASGAATLSLTSPAAGFFAAELPAPAPERPATALERVRERVAALRGRDFLDARLAALRDQRARLVPVALPAWGPRDLDFEPPLLDGYAARHADLADAQTALEVLRDAAPLREGSAVPLEPDAAPLSAPERGAVCGFRDALEEGLVALAASGRPDRGRAFLLGAARLLALDASCESGTLLVLDAFTGDAVEQIAAPQPEALALLQRDADRARARARQRFLAGGFDVRHLSDLEAAAARAAELQRAARLGSLLVAEERPVPGRAAPRVDLPPPPLSRATLESALARTREREREAERAIASLHAYHLTARNCVTELLRSVNHALGDSRAGIEAQLGGYLDPDAPGLFVPFVSASAVRASFRVVSERRVPSLRALQIAELAAERGRLATALRELSPLTARSYAPASADSPFLFFTDSAPALRPLFGAANLAAGAGAALWGLARAPFDGGRSLEAGLRGMLWSLPELVFVSVRKGTNEYVAPGWAALAKAALEGEGEAAYRKNANVQSTKSGISTQPDQAM